MSERTLERALSSLPREAWEMEEPPLFALPADRTAGELRSRGGGRPNVLTLRPVVAAALAASCVALGALAGGFLSGSSGGGDDGARAVALRPVAGASPAGAGTVEVGSRSAEVDVSRLRPNRRGDFYEVWLLTPPGKLVALGSFRVPASGATRIRVPLPTDPRGYELFDVSIEPGDGNPSHSGRSVLRAPTS